jgi:translocation and assembly module TamB
MRRALRIAAWTFGVAVTLTAVLIGAVLVAANTVRGRELIERAATRLSEGRVQLSGLSGAFPAEIDLAKLQLADAQGVWLIAEHLSLRWSPLALLGRHLDVQRLQLARLDVERRPLEAKSQGGSTHLPTIDIRQLSIERLELGPELAGARSALSVDGAVHVVSLADATISISAQRTDGAGRYRLGMRLDPSNVDATLRLEEPASGPLASLLGLPGLGALSIEAGLHGPRNRVRAAITAVAGAARADVQGSLDVTSGAANVAFHLDSGAMTPRDGLSWQSITAQGRWQGAAVAPHAAAKLRIERLQIADGVGFATLDANVAADRGAAAVRATVAGLVIPGSQPRLLADSPLRVAATLQLSDASRPLQLAAEHRLISLHVRARTAGARGAQLVVRLPDLEPLAALAGEKLRGRAELVGTIRQASPTTLRIELDGNTELVDGASPLGSMLAGPARLQLAATATPESIAVERATLSGRALSLSLSGSAQRGDTSAASALRSLQARYAISITNVAVLSPDVNGTLKLDGEIAGPMRSLASQMRLVSDLSIRGAPREVIEARLDARGLPTLTNATVQGHGQLAGAPLQLDASLERRAAGTFHVSVSRADWKSAHIDADLTTAAGTTPGHGTLRLRMERLDDLQPVIGLALKGSLAGTLSLRPAGPRTHAQLRVDARDIAAAGLEGNAQLSASGPLQALALRFSAQAPNLQGASANLDSAARLNLTGRKLRLEHAEAHYRNQSLRLLEGAELDFADGVAVSPVKIAVQNAVLEIEGRISPTLDLHASAHHIDAATVSAFKPGLLAAGTIDADARIKGAGSSRSGRATLTATGLQMAGAATQDVQPLGLHATARLEGERAQLDVQLNAGRNSQLRLAGAAPLDAAGALNLKLDGSIDLGLLNPLLEARGERMTGALTINAAVTGAARAPEIAGTVDLSHGDLRDYVQGVHLSDIRAHLVGSQGVLRLESLTASARPGQLSMTGQIGVLQPTLPLSLRLTAKNAQPLTSNIITANINADLEAEGSLRQRIDLSGTIDVNRAVIGIPNALPPEVAVLDVRRPGQAPPAPPPRKLIIGLDLKLHAPRQILVQGRGLNAELRGDLHIGGTSADPSVSGGFEMVRGTFALASSQLTFTDGHIRFNGAGLKGKIDPALDFTAETTVSDSTAKLHITGLADSPQFELSSTPPLPQDEILARLLFGESGAQLSALQLAEIGAALTTLSGVGGSGPNALANVQKALGLDRLSVGGGTSTQGTQSSGASVEAGRYVSSRVFVGAKESTTGFSQVEVDVDLSKHLKLQSRLGNGTTTTQGTTPENDPGSSVGLLYQFEY